MNPRAQPRGRWLLVVVFAIGMAWVEASSVYYLRAMVDRLNPYQANPLPMSGVLGQIEVVREGATLLMLFTLGMLSGRTWNTKLAYSAIAFGVWDLFYYLFLRLMCGWPASVFDWDILFLLPLPWWGPVLAPVCIALLMIIGGTLASERTVTGRSTFVRSVMWSVGGVGTALALYVFMADSLRAVSRGLEAARTVLPEAFNWPLFVVAFSLMTTPVVHAVFEQILRTGDPHGRPAD